MRTRLDEIVEEECRGEATYGGNEITVGRRVAERAFRHGVEQTKAAATCREANVYGINLKIPEFGNVQPAPAEDRCAGKTGIHVCPDRRKGERRTETITGSLYRSTAGGAIPMYAKDEGGWWCDRRSGKERRRG